MKNLLFTNSLQDNTVLVLSRYLKILKVGITDYTLSETLLSHPAYPAIWSISDVLNEYKIENGVFQLNPNQFGEIETPFITHLRVNKGWFVLVTSQNDKTISLFDSKKGRYLQTHEEFFKVWSGIVLIAEPDENSGERDYKLNFRKALLNKLRLPLIGLLSVFLITTGIINFTSPVNWQIYAYTICKVLGSIISGMLIITQFGSTNNLINKICHLNKKSDCDAVIHSPSARVFNFLSWSEVGLLYFIGGLLTILFSKNNIVDIQILALFTILSLPYTFWSIYFQWRIAKQWCMLCLAIQALLWLEFISVFSIIDFSQTDLNVFTVSSLVWGFGITGLVWLIIKPLLVSTTNGKLWRNELKVFKNNFEIFRVLLLNQPTMFPVEDDAGAILIGNLQAQHTVTLVTNLFCKACAIKHREIEKLLLETDNINFCMVFLSSPLNDGQKQIVVNILSLPAYQQAEAIKNWFSRSGNIETLNTQIDNENERNIAKGYMEKQNIWCDKNRIKFTPTLFFDNNRMPEVYSLEDLKNMTKYLYSKEIQ